MPWEPGDPDAAGIALGEVGPGWRPGQVSGHQHGPVMLGVARREPARRRARLRGEALGHEGCCSLLAEPGGEDIELAADHRRSPAQVQAARADSAELVGLELRGVHDRQAAQLVFLP